MKCSTISKQDICKTVLVLDSLIQDFENHRNDDFRYINGDFDFNELNAVNAKILTLTRDILIKIHNNKYEYMTIEDN